MASLYKLLREALGIDTAGDFPYTFPIRWEESLSMGVDKDITMSISLSSYWLYNIQKISQYFEPLSVSDSIIQQFKPLWLQSINLSALFRSQASFYRRRFEDLDIEDLVSLSKGIQTSVYQSISLIDVSIKRIWDSYKALLETIGITPLYRWIWNSYYVIFQGISLQDFVELATLIYKSLEQILDIWDSLVHIWNIDRTLFESPALLDYWGRQVSWLYRIYHTINLQDITLTSSTGFLKILYQGITALDIPITRIWNTTKLVLEPINLTDFLTRAWDTFYSLFTAIDIQDVTIGLFKGVRKTIPAEVIDLSEYIEYIWTGSFAVLESLNLIAFWGSAQDHIFSIFELLMIWESIFLWRAIKGIFTEPITLQALYNRIWDATGWYITGFVIPHQVTYRMDIVRKRISTLLLFDEKYYESIWKRAQYDPFTLSDILESKDLQFYLKTLLILTDQLSRQVDWKRWYFSALTLNDILYPIWAKFLDILDVLNIIDSFARVWDAIIDFQASLSVIDSLEWINTWKRSLLEDLATIEYLFRKLSMLLKQSIGIQDILDSIAQFYRVSADVFQLEVLLETSSVYIRIFLEGSSLYETISYIVQWSRTWLEQLSLLLSLYSIREFYRIFMNSLDLSEFYASKWDAFRVFLDSTIVQDTFGYLLERILKYTYTESIDLVVQLILVSSWLRRYSDSLFLIEAVQTARDIIIEKIDQLNLYSLLKTAAIIPLLRIEIIDILDLFYRIGQFDRALVEPLLITEFLSRIASFYRILANPISFVDSLKTKGLFKRLSIESFSLTLAFYKYIHLLLIRRIYIFIRTGEPEPLKPLSFRYWKPIREQLTFPSILRIKMLPLMQEVLNLIDTYSREWIIKRLNREALSLEDLILGPPPVIWEAIEVYLKKIATTLIAKMDRIQR